MRTRLTRSGWRWFRLRFTVRNMTPPRQNTAAELAAMRASFEAFMESQKAAQAEAKAVRKDILAGMDAIKAEATNVHHRVSKLESDMVKANEVVLTVNNWRAKLTGAVLVLGFIGTVALFVWQAVKEKVVSALFGG